MKITGLERDVFLFLTPHVYIRDFWARGELDENYKNGQLQVEVKIKNSLSRPLKNYSIRLDFFDEKQRPEIKNSLSRPLKNYSIRLDFFDEKQRPVFETPLIKEINLNEGQEKYVRLTRKVIDPQKWTAETPHLYFLGLSLLDNHQKTVEVAPPKDSRSSWL